MDLLFKALQDTTRRGILNLLKRRDMTAGEIADAFHITKPSISYHLDLLKQAGLVSTQKEGQFIRYSLETTVLDESIGWILELVERKQRNEQRKSRKAKVDRDRHPGDSFPRGHRSLA